MYLKYIQKTYNRRSRQLNGIEANEPKWAGQPDSVESVKNELVALETADKEIDTLEQQLLQKRNAARELCNQIETKCDETERRMKGIHANEKDKWGEYGSESVTNDRQSSLPPTTPLTLTVKDDTDGQGFIVTIERKDPDAEYYIFERGSSPDPKAIVPTSWQSFTEIPRLSAVDDNVESGIRYFYRVRAVNRKGKGPWSATVSKMQ